MNKRKERKKDEKARYSIKTLSGETWIYWYKIMEIDIWCWTTFIQLRMTGADIRWSGAPWRRPAADRRCMGVEGSRGHEGRVLSLLISSRRSRHVGRFGPQCMCLPIDPHQRPPSLLIRQARSRDEQTQSAPSSRESSTRRLKWLPNPRLI